MFKKTPGNNGMLQKVMSHRDDLPVKINAKHERARSSSVSKREGITRNFEHNLQGKNIPLYDVVTTERSKTTSSVG
jgi:hypothetical protein